MQIFQPTITGSLLVTGSITLVGSLTGTPHNAQVKLTVTNSAGSSSSTVICQYG